MRFCFPTRRRVSGETKRIKADASFAAYTVFARTARARNGKEAVKAAAQRFLTAL
jgi:hypothetical protein